MGRQIAAAAVPSHSSAWPPLRFTPKGTFQMTVFNDLHFGEAEDTDWGPLQDVDTLLVMETVLDKESPQLVVINGDFITGENTFKKNSTDYVDEIVSPLLARKLPWASTYGSGYLPVTDACRQSLTHCRSRLSLQSVFCRHIRERKDVQEQLNRKYGER